MESARAWKYQLLWKNCFLVSSWTAKVQDDPSFHALRLLFYDELEAADGAVLHLALHRGFLDVHHEARFAVSVQFHLRLFYVVLDAWVVGEAPFAHLGRCIFQLLLSQEVHVVGFCRREDAHRGYGRFDAQGCPSSDPVTDMYLWVIAFGNPSFNDLRVQR